MKVARYGVLFWMAALWLCAVGYAIVTVGRAAGSTEAELLYEASRIRRGLPLYVDPLVGALDDGPLSIRKHALYTPYWSLFLAVLPSGHDLTIGRLVSALAWFGGVPVIVWRATTRRSAGGADVGSVGARLLLPLGFFSAVAGAFFLVRAGIGCNVDPIATALAALAFSRVLSRDRAEPVDGALFALAALLKPHVAGMALGTFLCGRRVDRGGLLAFVGTLVVGSGSLYFGSHHAWPSHMLATSANPFDLARFADALLGYGAVLGLPHLVVAWALARYSLAAKSAPSALGAALAAPSQRVAFSGVLVSTALALVLMAKRGSATNYWLEPTAAATVALVTLPLPTRAWSLAALSAFAAAIIVMNARALPKEAAGWVDLDYSMRRARTLCTPRAGEVWGAGDPDLEWFLSGKVTRAPWQLDFLVRSGRFPAEPLEAEYEHGPIGCFAMHGAALSANTAPDAPPPENALFAYTLFQAMQNTFEPVGNAGDIFVYRRRRLGR